MPQSYIGAREPAGSESAAPTPQSAPPSPQFTESQQSRPPETASRGAGASPPAAEWLSLDATEPFPAGLFRVPVSDAVFSEMPERSDTALRSLLALLHLSYRYDPAEGTWVLPERSFSRRTIQEAAGLSSQGTRDGLRELEAAGWIAIDRSGRSHQYQLLLPVPDRRYTYVPTALLEAIGAFGSATELRVVLAVLRRTWGWTETVADPEGGSQTVHVRWTQVSTSSLADATGRSEAAVKAAAQSLQGRWIERVRPGNGAYQYRFLPEAIGDGSGDRSSFSPETAKNIPPDRQNSDPPSFSKESSLDKQARPATPKSSAPRPNGSATQTEEDALPEDCSPEKKAAATKLGNVGVWPERIAEVVSRYSTGRIEANFQLFRRRMQEEEIRNPAAWLYRAITQGYAGYTAADAAPGAPDPPQTDSGDEEALPPLSDRTRVSEAVKAAYVRRGVPESAFHLCKPGSAKPHMYFDPEGEGPTRRV